MDREEALKLISESIRRSKLEYTRASRDMPDMLSDQLLKWRELEVYIKENLK